MVNSILIGKLIYKLLHNDTNITNYVGKQIYPLVAEFDTKFPFITYTRDSVNSISCKDGYYEDNVTFSINIVSSNYLESLEIANIVRQIFEKNKIISDDITLFNVTLSSINEEYNNDAYVQTLTFNCTAQ